MKKVLIFCLIAVGYQSFSQTYMDKIAQESCDCISKVSETLDYEQYTQELGLCMIVASEPYRKQLKKDHNINFDKIEVDAEKLGKLIGFKMASVCPNSLLAVAKKSPNKTADASATTNDSKSIDGTVTKLEKDFFVVLHIKDGEGKTNKFYWLTFIDSDVDLIDRYDSMIGSPVEITYRTEEWFDPKIKEYRQFSVIEKLEARSN
jgi:hypothetical protein